MCTFYTFLKSDFYFLAFVYRAIGFIGPGRSELAPGAPTPVVSLISIKPGNRTQVVAAARERTEL